MTITFGSKTINEYDHFFTDSNGLGMIKRVIDEIKPYYVDPIQRQAHNYYPVNIAIMIEDKEMKN